MAIIEKVVYSWYFLHMMNQFFSELYVLCIYAKIQHVHTGAVNANAYSNAVNGRMKDVLSGS